MNDEFGNGVGVPVNAEPTPAAKPLPPILDLGAFDPQAISDAGVWVDIKRAGEPTGIRIKVAGPFSARADDFHRNKYRQVRADNKGKEFDANDPAFVREMTIQGAAHMTLDWEGVVVNGEPLKCSNDEAVKLYRKHYWIATQIDAAAGDQRRFLQVS